MIGGSFSVSSSITPGSFCFLVHEPCIHAFIRKNLQCTDPLALASGVTSSRAKSSKSFAKIRQAMAPYGRHLDRRSIEQLWQDEQKNEAQDASDADSEYE